MEMDESKSETNDIDFAAPMVYKDLQSAFSLPSTPASFLRINLNIPH
jgi:hypothetical protein